VTNERDQKIVIYGRENRIRKKIILTLRNMRGPNQVVKLAGRIRESKGKVIFHIRGLEDRKLVKTSKVAGKLYVTLTDKGRDLSKLLGQGRKKHRTSTMKSSLGD
jgi:DNA-binding MarR family transcriptional regulator